MEYVIHRRKENKTQWLNSEGKWTETFNEAQKYKQSEAETKAKQLKAKIYEHQRLSEYANDAVPWNIFIVSSLKDFIGLIRKAKKPAHFASTDKELNKNIMKVMLYGRAD